MSLKPKKKKQKADKKPKNTKKLKQVHSVCGKSDITLTDKYKRINPKYVGICNVCMFPIAKSEILSKSDYKESKKLETHIKVDDGWVSFD